MSSQKTQNYDLNQWLPDDSVLRTDFNADNAKIDAALKTSADAVAALEGQLNANDAAHANFGNCTLQYQTYTGNGASARTFTFSGKPYFICIMGGDYFLLAVQGTPYSICYGGGSDASSTAVWNGSTVTLSSSSGWDHFICNLPDSQYFLVALLDAGD